jgi:hypothetical protein
MGFQEGGTHSDQVQPVMQTEPQKRIVIDLDAIKRSLYDKVLVRSRIARDFALTDPGTGPVDFFEAVIAALDQPPCRPLEKSYSNNEVFRAAVRALGSNSRSWATYLRVESRLRELLCGFDAIETKRHLDRESTLVDQFRKCLPGVTAGADARAIVAWADALATCENYYDRLRLVGHDFWEFYSRNRNSPTESGEMMLCVVGFLTNLPVTGERSPTGWSKPPGMGLALTSEFLRNLGWSGFKADRHIRRLFDQWFEEVPPDWERIHLAEGLISAALQRFVPGHNVSHRSDLRTYLRYSILGITSSPVGVPYSRVDNLVWLLGAYVERKGRESMPPPGLCRVLMHESLFMHV